MKILVTGAAGFIGFHLSKILVESGHTVVGLDNINDYYDPQLKYDRLNELGVLKEDANKFNFICSSSKFEAFQFIRLNIEDREKLPELFGRYRFEKVVNLA
ncbi:MAG: GDP-mannose 4,6-dehydratase, partial [Flavobacteriaceae bacterium]|nr:GDP-mannose 4,6-dehydratase [Flavobacteriaceae bacterium]